MNHKTAAKVYSCIFPNAFRNIANFLRMKTLHVKFLFHLYHSQYAKITSGHLEVHRSCALALFVKNGRIPSLPLAASFDPKPHFSGVRSCPDRQESPCYSSRAKTSLIPGLLLKLLLIAALSVLGDRTEFHQHLWSCASAKHLSSCQLNTSTRNIRLDQVCIACGQAG